MSNYNEKEIFDLLQEEQKKKSEKPEKVISKSRENKDVLRFIRKFQIEPGPYKVPNYLIYYHFIKWHRFLHKKQLKKEGFFRTFKKHFEQKRSGNQRFYMINDSLDLSSEAYEKAEKYDQKWQKRGKSKK